MAERQPRTVVARLGHFSLAISVGLFLVFMADVLLGKAGVTWGWDVPVQLGDVGEYLVLLSTAFFFTVATLLRESQSRDESSSSDADRTVHQPSATTEEKNRDDR